MDSSRQVGRARMRATWRPASQGNPKNSRVWLRRLAELPAFLEEEMDQQDAHDQMSGRGVKAGEVSAFDQGKDEVGDRVDEPKAHRIEPQHVVGDADLVESPGRR